MWSPSSLRRTSKRRSSKTAFTAVEGLITLGLVALITGLTIPVYRSYQIRGDLDNATEQIVQMLRRAQTLAQSGQNDAMFGVYVQEGTLFQGDAYVLRNPAYDEVYGIPDTIDASGLDEVVFTRLEGIPLQTGIIRLTALSGQYRDVTVDDNGVVTVGNILSAPDYQPIGGEDGGVGDTGETGDDGETAGDTGQTAGDTGQTAGDTGAATGGASSGGASSSAGTTGGTTGGQSSSQTSGQTAGDAGGETTGGTSSSAGTTGGTTGGDTGGDDDDDGSTDRCHVAFDLQDDRLTSVGTNDVTLRVLGSEITYGAGGPPVDVRVSVSINHGETWIDLNNGNPVRGGEIFTLTNLPEGTPVVIRVNGRYSWLFNKTYQSDDRSGHIEVLRDGDGLPKYKPFDNQQSLAGFLREIIDSQKRIDIGPRDVVFLTELGTLGSTSADFQDLVLLATFTQKAQTCVSDNEVKLKLSFNRLENSGQGNVDNKVYVGPQAIAFSEEQWIPLTNNGQIIVDSGIQELVSGLALERGPGWVRILNHGSHPVGSHKEIVDARALFNKAYITSVVNDGGQNAAENPTDGVVNDGSAGDEFVGGPNEKSMEFKTRVTTADDAVILYWTQGNPPNNGQSSSSQSSVSQSSVASVDTCAVPFTVAADGSVTLGGSADISVAVRGSEGTYGYRGPALQLRMRASTNGGSAYIPLFNNRRIKENDFTVLRNIGAGSVVKLQFEGRYSWYFRRTVESGAGDDRVLVRARGGAIPSVLIQAKPSLKPFLRDLIDAQNTVAVGARQVAYLVELGEIDATADYHDAVVVLSIDKPASQGGCAPAASSSSSSSAAQSSSSSSSAAATNPNADDDGDNVKNKDDICAGTYMPETVPTEYMLFDRYALTEKANKPGKENIFRVGPRKKTSEFTLADTRGCSCGQILDAIDGKGTHRFDEYPALYRSLKSLFSFYVSSSRQFGCSDSLMRMVRDAF